MIGRPLEWTPERIDKEALALIAWSKKKNSLVLSSFCIDQEPPYSPSVMNRLAGKHEGFCEAFAVAKVRVARNREQGGLEKKLDSSLVAKTMAFYDADYKAHLIEMKKAESDGTAEAQAQHMLDFAKALDCVSENSKKNKN